MNNHRATTDNFISTLGLKAVARQVLLDIITHGVSSVADIATRLAMPKSTVYDALPSLVEASLVNEYHNDNDRGKTFGISDNDQLSRVHRQKMLELQNAHASFISFIEHHQVEENVPRPKIKFYAGTIGIKQAFRDMPWEKRYTEAYLMWPMQDMLDSLDEEFLRWHGEQRHQYKVVLYSIEKHGDRALQSKEHAWLENNIQKTRTKVRYLAKGVDWKMSYWLYGDKCLFASGGMEKFAFVIHSKEFCHMMKLMWQEVWEKAKD